jgi:hypothetical protein
MPAMAQEDAAPAAAAGAQAAPAPPGGDVLPLPPGGGFGFPNPLNPPNALNPNPAAPPLAVGGPAGPLGLAAPGIGVVPLQANDPNAPAILIQPTASVTQTFTDNVNFVHAPRRAAAYTTLSPGVSISADTPRLQAIFSGSLNGYFYVPTSNFNQVTGSLYASAFGTVVPDALFVDARSSISQSTTLPGFGFQNLSQLPANQQTQTYSNTISPFLRKSFDGLVDTELRYTFGQQNFGGNTTVLGPATPATPTLLVPTTVSNAIFNEGTFIAATGSDFRRALSRLTIDASNYNASSASQNKQFSAYDDLEYRIAPQVAALARAGYQNIQYPFAPAATFVGATWLIGGRVGTYGPDPAYFALEYGRQQGVYGFTGSARYNITPTMLFTASLVQGVSSPAQYLLSSLETSTLDAYGAIVDQYSGLPTAFYSPGIGLSNNVYKQHLLNMGITETIGPNHYTVYASYANQQSLTPPTTTAPTKTYGINFNYGRDMRPDLTGNASLGYANSSNVIISTTATPISNTNQITGYLGLNYLLGQSLTGSVYYSLSYFTNGAGGATGRSGDVVVNQLTFALSKTF